MRPSDRGGEGAPTAPRRREQTDLYATILEVVKRHHGAARITRVSYGAGMPVDRLRTAMERLARLGLLSASERDGRTLYDITPRGHEFLTTYWKMRGFVDLFDERADRPV